MARVRAGSRPETLRIELLKLSGASTGLTSAALFPIYLKISARNADRAFMPPWKIWSWDLRFATETMKLIILGNDRVMDDGLARRNDFRSSD